MCSNNNAKYAINQLSITSVNLQSTDNFLQNEINLINILAISSGNVDIDYGISIAQD